MTRRKLFLVGVTAVVACALFPYLAFTPRVTAENYHQIHDGMNLADVEALLGRPIGDPIPAVNFLFLCSSVGTLREEYAALEGTDDGLQWHDGGGTILVGFRPGGTVTFKRFDPPHEEPLLDKFRRWLHL
jgi:hypothetical protein